MKKFGLLVGNGFTLDFIEPKGFHSSHPLKNFSSLKIKYQSDFMNNLPEIKKLQSNRDPNDFEAIESYVKKFKEIEEEHYSLPPHEKYAHFVLRNRAPVLKNIQFIHGICRPKSPKPDAAGS